MKLKRGSMRALILVAVVVVGCGAQPGPSPGAGDDDSGQPMNDAGFDAGNVDAGTVDSGMPDSGAPDAGDAVDSGMPDAGPPSMDAGVAIVAPADQWTWVDFPDSHCAIGSTTGLGINPHAGATSLLIYFEGGGSCHDAETCFGSMPTAKDTLGYGPTQFAAAAQRNYPVLNRTDAGSPFAEMNMVYVPYCTGDLHAGDQVSQLPLADGGTIATHFVGAANVRAYLARLVPTFPGIERVWLLGTSAGGFGTFLNFDRVATAFGVGVDIIDDSGPAITEPGAPDNHGLFAVWNLVPPAGCAGCTSLREILNYDLQTQQNSGWNPSGQYGFLSYLEDTTIGPDFGYLLPDYATAMTTYSGSLPAAPQAATLLVSNKQSHVVESDPTLIPQYLPWMSAMVSRDAGWADVAYMHP